MRIFIADVRRAGYCTFGARKWFRRHGLDFRTFKDEGMDADVLLATGDALAADVIDKKRERQRDQEP